MFIKPRKQLFLVQTSYGRMNYKRYTSLALAVLFLYNLVVSVTSAKFRRNRPLKELKKISIEVVHSFTGQFLEAPDTVEVKIKANFFQRATAVPLNQSRVVPILYIE